MDDMKIQEPEPKKVGVIDYHFTFLGGKSLDVTVWPTLGDVVEENVAGWVFTFPRMKRKNTVLRVNLLDIDEVESERVDPTEVIERTKREILDRLKADAKAKEKVTI